MVRQKKWARRGNNDRGNPRLLNQTVTMNNGYLGYGKRISAAAKAVGRGSDGDNDVSSISSLNTSLNNRSIGSKSSSTGRGSIFSRKKLIKKMMQQQKKKEEEQETTGDYLSDNYKSDIQKESGDNNNNNNISGRGLARAGQHKTFHPVRDPQIVPHAKQVLTGRPNHYHLLFGNTNNSNNSNNKNDTSMEKGEDDSDEDDDDDDEEEEEEENNVNVKSKQEEDDEEQDRAAAEIEREMEKETGFGLQPIKELGNSKASLMTLEPLTSAAEFRRPAPVDDDEEEPKLGEEENELDEEENKLEGSMDLQDSDSFDANQTDQKKTPADQKFRQIGGAVDDDGSGVVVFEDDTVDRSGVFTDNEHDDSPSELRSTPRSAPQQQQEQKQEQKQNDTSDSENPSSGSEDALGPMVSKLSKRSVAKPRSSLLSSVMEETQDGEDYQSNAPAKIVKSSAETKPEPPKRSWMAALTNELDAHAEHRIKATVKKALLEEKRKKFPLVVVKGDNENWREEEHSLLRKQRKKAGIGGLVGRLRANKNNNNNNKEEEEEEKIVKRQKTKPYLGRGGDASVASSLTDSRRRGDNMSLGGDSVGRGTKTMPAAGNQKIPVYITVVPTYYECTRFGEWILWAQL